ncbi:hypothetical protein ACJX0J_038134 [Zea mays]
MTGIANKDKIFFFFLKSNFILFVASFAHRLKRRALSTLVPGRSKILQHVMVLLGVFHPPYILKGMSYKWKEATSNIFLLIKFGVAGRESMLGNIYDVFFVKSYKLYLNVNRTENELANSLLNRKQIIPHHLVYLSFDLQLIIEISLGLNDEQSGVLRDHFQGKKYIAGKTVGISLFLATQDETR